MSNNFGGQGPIDMPSSGWHTAEWFALALNCECNTLLKKIRRRPTIRRKRIGNRLLVEATSFLDAFPEEGLNPNGDDDASEED